MTVLSWYHQLGSKKNTPLGMCCFIKAVAGNGVPVMQIDNRNKNKRPDGIPIRVC